MSEYTTRQILDMIEANGGPEGLDLSGKDLSEIDLSHEAIQAELARVREENPEATPVWVSVLTGGINLGGINLEEANLQKADLFQANLREASLWRANLQEASLLLANLQEAELLLANLQRADMRGAELQGAFFSGVRLDHTEMDRSSLEPKVGEDREGRYDVARDAYLRLKQNFDDLGDYDAASWAYRKERRMEKLAALQKAKEAWQKHDWKEAIPRYAKVAGDWVIECVCDYGEGFWNVVRSLIAVWVIFALIYGLIGGVWGPWQDTVSGRIRSITRNPIDLLWFSLGTMVTLHPPGLEARSTLFMRFLVPSQALLGIFLAGLLGFVAGNRIRRS